MHRWNMHVEFVESLEDWKTRVDSLTSSAPNGDFERTLLLVDVDGGFVDKGNRDAMCSVRLWNQESGGSDMRACSTSPALDSTRFTQLAVSRVGGVVA